jgi:hypothetical protein
MPADVDVDAPQREWQQREYKNSLPKTIQTIAKIFS